MATYVQRLNSRSPFYLTRLAGTYILTGTCKVWIYDGDPATDRPATPTYTITKNALTSTSTEIVFEVSQLIRDYFNHNRDVYEDGVGNTTDVIWCEIELTSTDSGSAPATVSSIYLAVDGYGYFTEGVNYAGTNFFTPTINNPIDKVINIGVFAGNSADDGVDTVKYYNGSTLIQTDSLSVAVSDTENFLKNQYLTFTQNIVDRFEDRVQADSGTYAINTCFNTFAPPTTESTIDTIELIRSSVVLETIAVNNIEECKYTYNTIKFYDRNGLLQQIYMFKKSTDKIAVKKKSYNSIMGAVSGGAYTYSVEKHQVKDYNVTVKESITLNSGFVGEEQNEVFRQVLLSEFVWVDDRPVSVKTNSLNIKKHINDKLINYSLDFEYSNNIINNIY